MKSEKQILEQRATVFAAMQDLTKRAKDENRALTADESASFDKADADFKQYTQELDELRSNKARHDKMTEYEGLMGEQAPSETETRQLVPGATKDAASGKDAYKAAVRNWLIMSNDDLSAEERTLLKKHYETRGTDTQVSSTQSLGGYAMPEDWANDLYRAMLWYGGALEACGISLKTPRGGDFHYPTVNDTSNKGAIIAQGTGDTVKDLTLSEIVFKTYSYTSGLIKFSWESFDDLVFNIDRVVNEICAERLGRILNEHFTTGDNSGKPQGLVNGSTLGKAAASATAFTRSELVDLYHSVDKSHRNGPKCGWMFNDTTLSYIKKLAFGSADDRPLWQISIREGEPDRLEGKPYWVNNDMANIATTAKSVLFGNFDKYKIRQTGNMVMAKSTERYIEERAVAFFVFGRFDGRYLDTAAVKHLIHA